MYITEERTHRAKLRASRQGVLLMRRTEARRARWVRRVVGLRERQEAGRPERLAVGHQHRQAHLRVRWVRRR